MTMTNKKLNISQIAELAEVSKATVSRVLNGHPHIRAEIREKVQRVIAETGYQPSYNARRLASDRSNIIGFIVPSFAQSLFSDPYYPAVTQGISRVSNEHQLTLALFIFHSREDGHITFNNILAKRMLDGLIITADRKDDIFIAQLIENHIPFVHIGRPESYLDKVNYVDTDNVNGGLLATEHLIEKGYRRIGIIGSDSNSAGDDRYAGYCQALAQAGIEYNEALVVHGDYTMESGVKGMRQLLPAKPDAVFVVSDTMAVGALRVLREEGLRVPQDIGIVSYDDLPPSLLADPPLTTIRQPIEETGQLAVETLMAMLDNPQQPPKHIILLNQLIVRASTR
jgi:LacI family transcriptional regulator